ncbi:hypothetical protein, partial [Pedobacter nanyangensis]|uniref:hypothetical protein n=1 Tax=Pedobacter nanyangensis TaxID=1562389 RepID=UPI00196647CD
VATLKKKKVATFGISPRARLYTNITDYFTFSKYPKGWDPEVSRTGYPITKSIVFGLSVKL